MFFLLLDFPSKALAPSSPYFTTDAGALKDASCRLDKDDAAFVDAIHTDIPSKSEGTMALGLNYRVWNLKKGSANALNTVLTVAFEPLLRVHHCIHFSLRIPFWHQIMIFLKILTTLVLTQKCC